MNQYKCDVCGYIYDEDKGDPEGGIVSGTPMKELPVDWVCPDCGATPAVFLAAE